MNAKYDFIFLPILYDTRFCINCYLSNSLLNLIQNFIHSWLYPWTGSIPKLDLGIYQIWQNPQLDVLILVNIYSNSSQNIYVLHLILASLIRTFGNCICSAAAAKSLQSCPSLCDPIDGSPPGSPVPGILQAGTLEWVAISFSSAWKWRVKVKSLSHVQLLATPWTAAYQAPPSMGFSRQEHWSGCHCLLLLVVDTHTSNLKIRESLRSNWHCLAPFASYIVSHCVYRNNVKSALSPFIPPVRVSSV